MRVDATDLLYGLGIPGHVVVQTPNDFADEQYWKPADFAARIDPHLIPRIIHVRPGIRLGTGPGRAA
jgi:hypothetical protein